MAVMGTENYTTSYTYDAFGNEKAPDPDDANPFRYCGEYLDAETGTYYLRARYYDPAIGHFTQEDTHWNTANMIYGDNPQKINQREDRLGLKTYTTIPQNTAVMQAGNLYVYGVNNPVAYIDQSGQFLGIALSVFGEIEVAVELVCTVLGISVAAIALLKITQRIVKDLAKYLGIAAEQVEWLINKIQETSDEDSTDNNIDVTPSDNHTTTTKNPGPKGKPNSSVDIVDKNGNVITRRWYDENGRAYRDVDMTDHCNPKMHPKVPHEHHWDWSDPKHPLRIP